MRKLTIISTVLLVWIAFAITREQLVPFNADDHRKTILLTGDEPEYLLAATSVALDFDMNLRNNLKEKDYTIFQRNKPCGYGHANLRYFLRVSPAMTNASPEAWLDKQLLVHRPATSVLIAPATWAGNKMRWTSYLIISTFICAAMFLILYTATKAGVSPPLACIVVALTGLCPPSFYYANQAYPELPAAMILACTFALLLVPSSASLTLASLLIALVPWFSDRAIPAAACAAIAVLLICKDKKTLISILSIFIIGAILLAAYYFRRFHVPFPVHHNPRYDSSLTLIPTGLPRALIDRGRGLIWMYPVIILLPVAFTKWWKSREHQTLCLLSVASFTLTLLVISAFPDWQGGTCPAGRYGVILQWLALPAFLMWMKLGLSSIQKIMLALPLLYGAGQSLILYSHPNWWYRTYNPLFAQPLIQRCYPLLPNFKEFNSTSILTACVWVAVFAIYAWLAYNPEGTIRRMEEKIKG